MQERVDHPIQSANIEKIAKELVFNTLFNTLPIAFYWMDREGYQLGCNDLELKLLKLSSMADFIGKHSSEISNSIAWENSKMVMESNQVMTMEEQWQPEPGQVPRHYLSIKSPIHDDDGKVIGMLGVSLDISERKRAEELLHEAKEKAEYANRAKTEFLSMVSHELRIPLSGILGMARLLDLEYLLPPLHEQTQDIIDASEHLLALVDDLLDVAKLESGKMELHIVPFDLRRMLEDTVTILTFQAKSKGLELLLNYEEDVPAIILGDIRALRQIVLNLVGNALKFTAQGYVIIRIRCVEKTDKHATLAISIEDTGIGIAKDKLQHVFERFQQAGDPTYKRRYGGTGLGLTISKAYTELMDGRVEVQSELGKGSIFSCIIPFQLPSESMVALPWEQYKAHVKVLIVDDTLRGEVLKKHVSASHSTVVKGKDALKVLLAAMQAKQSYDVVIIDQQITSTDAMTLGQQINKQLAPHKPMLLLLVPTLGVAAKDAIKMAGFYEVIVKPAQPTELLINLTAAWERWDEKQRLKEYKNKPTHIENSPHILLVEDDRIVQKVHRMMLERLGYQVDLAEDGQKALEKTSTNYDAIFMDVGLPGMSGLEVTSEIRKREGNNKRIPIIAMTAYVYEEDRNNCLAAGMDDIATKPISFPELQKILKKWVVERKAA